MGIFGFIYFNQFWNSLSVCLPLLCSVSTSLAIFILLCMVSRVLENRNKALWLLLPIYSKWMLPLVPGNGGQGVCACVHMHTDIWPNFIGERFGLCTWHIGFSACLHPGLVSFYPYFFLPLKASSFSVWMCMCIHIFCVYIYVCVSTWMYINSHLSICMLTYMLCGYMCVCAYMYEHLGMYIHAVGTSACVHTCMLVWVSLYVVHACLCENLCMHTCFMKACVCVHACLFECIVCMGTSKAF